jgi:beta-glucosidase
VGACRSPGPPATRGCRSTRPVDGQLAYDEGLHIGHRWYDREDREPLYRFGHGLGFTTWEYLSADSDAAGDAEAGTTVTVRVRNTGARRGREVVQIYAGRPDSCIDRPRRWLAGFAVVDAEPGGEVTATVTVPARAFQHWDVMTQRWTVEPGTFRLFVGSSSGDLPLALDVDVQGP